jgi:hypothetical protein
LIQPKWQGIMGNNCEKLMDVFQLQQHESVNAGGVHRQATFHIKNQHLRQSQPLQVQCCWNVAAVLDASRFMPPYNVRFRREESV